MAGFLIHKKLGDPSRLESSPPGTELEVDGDYFVEFYNDSGGAILVSIPRRLDPDEVELEISGGTSAGTMVHPKRPGVFTCKITQLRKSCPMCGYKHPPVKGKKTKKAAHTQTAYVMCRTVNQLAVATLDDGDPVIIIKPKG